MKSILYRLLLWTGMLGTLEACNSELDRLRPHNVSEEKALFTTMDGFTRTLEGCYSLSMTFADEVSFAAEAHGNNLKKMELTTLSAQADLFNFLHTDRAESNSNFSKKIWSNCYKMIVNLNMILRNIPGHEMTDELKQVNAEALFLRAFGYFNLVRLYGLPYYRDADSNPGIVLIPEQEKNAAKLSRATVACTYEQIITDLKAAIALFTGNRGNSYGSKYAAEALLARVYLYMGGTFEAPDREYNQSVIDYATDVILNGGYELLQGEEYKNYYNSQNTGNREDIFATNTESSNNGSFLSFYYMQNTGNSGGGAYAPSAGLKALLTDGDYRLCHYVEASYNLNGGGADDNLATAKYMIKRSGSSRSPIRQIRLAEMYLNRAEAYVKLGGAANEELALKDLNKVVLRAGLMEIPALSGEALFQEILKQRRIELAFEGHIGFDYFRNGLPMERNYSSHGSTISKIEANNPKIVLRIPIDEIRLNPNLKQNEQ